MISIITVTNRPKNLIHIARQVCAQQTDEKIEHILVLDGPQWPEKDPKSSWNGIKYRNVIPQIKALYTENNITFKISPQKEQSERYLFEKLAALRNHGTTLAEEKSKYFAFWDDDNQWHPNHLQSLVTELQNVGDDISAAHSWRYMVTANGMPALVQDGVYPWDTPREEVSREIFRVQKEAGILTVGSNIIKDRYNYDPIAPACCVDTGEWLFLRKDFIPFNDSLSNDEKMVGYTDDQLLGLRYVKAKRKVACTKQATLIYQLGGNSQKNNLTHKIVADPFQALSLPEPCGLDFLAAESPADFVSLTNRVSAENAATTQGEIESASPSDRAPLFPYGHPERASASDEWELREKDIAALYESSPYAIDLSEEKVASIKERSLSINWKGLGQIVESKIRAHLKLSPQTIISVVVFGSIFFKDAHQQPGDLDIVVVVENTTADTNVGSPVNVIDCKDMNTCMPDAFKFIDEKIDLSIVSRDALLQRSSHSGDLTNIAVWSSIAGVCLKGNPLVQSVADFLLPQEIFTSIGFNFKGNLSQPKQTKRLNVLIRSYQSLAMLAGKYNLADKKAEFLEKSAKIKLLRSKLSQGKQLEDDEVDISYGVNFFAITQEINSAATQMSEIIKSKAIKQLNLALNRRNTLAAVSSQVSRAGLAQLDHLLNHQRIIHKKNKLAAQLAPALVSSGRPEAEVLELITKIVQPIIPPEQTTRDQPMPDKNSALAYYYAYRYQETADQYHHGMTLRYREKCNQKEQERLTALITRQSIYPNPQRTRSLREAELSRMTNAELLAHADIVSRSVARNTVHGLENKVAELIALLDLSRNAAPITSMPIVDETNSAGIHAYFKPFSEEVVDISDWDEAQLKNLAARSKNSEMSDEEAKNIVLCIRNLEAYKPKKLKILIEKQGTDKVMLYLQILMNLSEHNRPACNNILEIAAVIRDDTLEPPKKGMRISNELKRAFNQSAILIKPVIEFNYKLQDGAMLYALNSPEAVNSDIAAILIELSNQGYLERDLAGLFEQHDHDELIALIKTLYTRFGVPPEADLIKYFIVDNKIQDIDSVLADKSNPSACTGIFAIPGASENDLLEEYLTTYNHVNVSTVLNYSFARYRKQRFIESRLIVEQSFMDTYPLPSLEMRPLLLSGQNPIKEEHPLQNSADTDMQWLVVPINKAESRMRNYRISDSVPTCLVNRNRMYNTDLVRMIANPATMAFDITRARKKDGSRGLSIGFFFVTLGVERQPNGQEYPILIVNPPYNLENRDSGIDVAVLSFVNIELAPKLGARKVYTCDQFSFISPVQAFSGFNRPSEGTTFKTIMALKETPVCHLDATEVMNSFVKPHRGIRSCDLHKINKEGDNEAITTLNF